MPTSDRAVLRAPIRVVRELESLVRTSVCPYADAEALACLAAAARAEAQPPAKVDATLHEALERVRAAGRWVPQHAEVVRTLLRVLDERSSEEAPLDALVALARALRSRGRRGIRLRTIEGLLGAGDLAGARALAGGAHGFDRTRARRAVERGTVSDRTGERFVARLAPPVLRELAPSAAMLRALGLRAVDAYEPWIACEAQHALARLDSRERARAMPYRCLVQFASLGGASARRAALAIAQRSLRERAIVSLVHAALARSDLAFALELLAHVRGAARERAYALVLAHPRPGLPDSPPLTGDPLRDAGERARWVVAQLRRAFAEDRASRFAHPAFAHGVRGETDEPPAGSSWDPISLERALFDEGLARSPRGAARRSVLVRAIKHALKREVLRPGTLDPAALSSRIRTLLTIGGPPVCDVLERVIEAARESSGALEVVLQALALVDADRAARWFARLQRFWPDRADLLRVTIALQRLGVFDPAFPERWRLHDLVARGRTARQTASWLDRLLAAARARGLNRPDTLLAHAFVEAATARSEARRRIASEPDVFLSGMFLELSRQLALPPRRYLLRLLRRPHVLALAGALNPAVLTSRMEEWSLERTRSELHALDYEAGWEVDADAVVRFARSLGSRDAQRRTTAFLDGYCPIDDARVIALDGGVRIRWLDKRADLLSYVRFADVVPCCLSSTSEDVPYHVLLVWCDPLSFVCMIERVEQCVVRPIGSILGGFALVGDRHEPAMVLNGIYLTRQADSLRCRILDAVEARLAAPLGVVSLGIAAMHGGKGALPDRYRASSVSLVRLRALRENDDPMHDIFDDVSWSANLVDTVEHVYWHRLRSAPAHLVRLPPELRT
jgi:hypothetical protein